MEAIRDMSWMRHLALGKPEHFELGGYRVALVSVEATAAHHGDRFRYRLLAFDPGLGKPFLSVDLESDILGDYCLSVEFQGSRHVLERFDSPPALGEFRERAVAEALSRLPGKPA
ncbi:MAG TPA: hypothetical protein VFL04_01015 [Rectinemataceae bacterium]|nr:hypothetical protein [Rectinemataceae bacterium]